jgi:uncharacterized RDD family membrane protein YckC
MSTNPDQLNPEQHSIDTPELVAIQMPLAGLGSRFLALLVDSLLWTAAILLLVLLFVFLMPAIRSFNKLSAQWTFAIIVFLIFLFNWGYFTLFEAFWNGQTPGKKIAHIRVIQRSGRPIGLLESMARNFIRYIDSLPTLYLIGILSIFLTRQHQRLGDLAAGTLVVRDEPLESSSQWNGSSLNSSSRIFTSSPLTPVSLPPEPHMLVTLPITSLAKLSPADLEVLENFLARRLDMPLDARATLATRIATALQSKSGLEIPSGVSTETFLEAAAHQLRDLARIS